MQNVDYIHKISIFRKGGICFECFFYKYTTLKTTLQGKTDNTWIIYACMPYADKILILKGRVA